MFDLHQLPAWPQSQESLATQIATLIQVANKLGLFDAADAVKQMASKLDQVEYGCHVESNDGRLVTVSEVARPPLSPAAQAVLDAVASSMEGGWISPDFIRYEARKAAAILRALAKHQHQPIAHGEPIDYWDPDDRTRRELRNLADELEGTDG